MVVFLLKIQKTILGSLAGAEVASGFGLEDALGLLEAVISEGEYNRDFCDALMRKVLA